VISDGKSSWQPAASGVAQGSILGAVVFKLGDEREAILSKFVGSSKLGGVDQGFLVSD